MNPSVRHFWLYMLTWNLKLSTTVCGRLNFNFFAFAFVNGYLLEWVVSLTFYFEPKNDIF